MTIEQFEKIVNYYGISNILGLSFDNSAAKMFSSGEFTKIEDIYEANVDCFHFVDFDNKGRPFHVIKPTDSLQCVIVRDASINFDEYDRISLRS